MFAKCCAHCQPLNLRARFPSLSIVLLERPENLLNAWMWFLLVLTLPGSCYARLQPLFPRHLRHPSFPLFSNLDDAKQVKWRREGVISRDDYLLRSLSHLPRRQGCKRCNRGAHEIDGHAMVMGNNFRAFYLPQCRSIFSEELSRQWFRQVTLSIRYCYVV